MMLLSEPSDRVKYLLKVYNTFIIAYPHRDLVIECVLVYYTIVFEEVDEDRPALRVDYPVFTATSLFIFGYFDRKIALSGGR